MSRIWGRRQEPPLPSCCPLRPKGKLETGGLWHAQRASSEAPPPLSGPFPWLFLQADGEGHSTSLSLWQQGLL